MKLGIFGKDKKEKKEENKTPKEFGNVDTVDAKKQPEITGPTVLPKEYGALKGFYVSEKASWLNSFNQYVFKVFGNTTKNEVKKQVEKSFDVKVKNVKIINLPRKRRNVGRHSGFRPGFKKAIVVLKEGYTIDQAKA